MRGMILLLALESSGCSPKCSTPCSTGTCASAWLAVNPGKVLREPDYAFQCVGPYYKDDCDTYWTCDSSCVYGCSYGGNCAQHWMYQDWDRASFLCSNPTAYRSNCDGYWSVTNCRLGPNRGGNCASNEMVQLNDRAYHCADSISYRDNCDSYWSNKACRNGIDRAGLCYGHDLYRAYQPSSFCGNSIYRDNCDSYWSVTACRGAVDRTGNCYQRKRKDPVYGLVTHCPYKAYRANCDTYWSITTYCAGAITMSGGCYLRVLTPPSMYAIQCSHPNKDAFYGDCDSYWHTCSCTTGPCKAESNVCWTAPTSCPDECANGCDELGQCNGWRDYWDPDIALHCIVGRYGFGCQNVCPSNCLKLGCTAGGLCIDYHLNLWGLPTHCKPLFWGDTCLNPCPTVCARECTNDGVCVGWNLVISQSKLQPSTVVCQNGYWGSDCASSSSTKCVYGTTIEGKCMGWWNYSGPAEEASHCTTGNWGHGCQWTCEACKGACTTRGFCAPYERLTPRGSVAQNCLPSRNYGKVCELTCDSSCQGCRIDGYCVDSTVAPLCGNCLVAGCNNGACQGYSSSMTVLPTWCKPGFWDAACTSPCPAGCATGCTNTGICIGWDKANAYQKPGHCVAGFWGKTCDIPCAHTCNCSTSRTPCPTTSGCTGDGSCLRWELASDNSLASHCWHGCSSSYICDLPGYYGARCDYACPQNCAKRDGINLQSCTGFGKCFGWNSYTNPATEPVGHCLPGWFGPTCEAQCPQFCANGCTPQGWCNGHHLATKFASATHCINSMWGRECLFECSAKCCSGCTGTGQCVGWEMRLLDEGFTAPASHCLTSFYGDDCKFWVSSGKQCAQKGATNAGFCIGVPPSTSPKQFSVCANGYTGSACDRPCSGGCPNCGYCGERQIGTYTSRCNSLAPGPPMAPLNVSVVTGDRTAEIYWMPPSDNGNMTVWGYIVRIESGPTIENIQCGTEAAPCPGPPIQLGRDTPMKNFIPYTISIAAINSAKAEGGKKAEIYDVITYPPGPRLLEWLPANNSWETYPNSITLQFDRPVQWGSTVDGSTKIFTLEQLTGTTPRQAFNVLRSETPLSSTTGILTIPGIARYGLIERSQYMVSLSPNVVLDVATKQPNFAMNADQLKWVFIAADITPPAVTKTIPLNKEMVQIGLDSLQITFSEPVFRLRQGRVKILYMDPNSTTPMVRQSWEPAPSSAQGDVSFKLYGAAVHLPLATYCVDIDNDSFADAPPYNNAFPGLFQKCCFTTSDTIPQYMQANPAEVAIVLNLRAVQITLNSTPSVEQFKFRLINELALVSGLSIKEASVRFSIVSISRLNLPQIGGQEDLKVVVDIADLSQLPSSSTVGLPIRLSKDPATIATELQEISKDSSTMWNSDSRLILLPSSTFQSMKSDPGQVLEIETEVRSNSLNVKVTLTGVVFSVFAVVVDSTAGPVPQSIDQILSTPRPVCVINSRNDMTTTLQEFFFKAGDSDVVALTIPMSCTGMLARKRYVLALAASSRPANQLTTAVPVSQLPFYYISSIAPELLAVILFNFAVIVAVAMNIIFFKDSKATALLDLMGVATFFSDLVYANFLHSMGLNKFVYIVLLATFIPIGLNFFVTIGFFLIEFKSSTSFADAAFEYKAIVAAVLCLSFIKSECMRLLSSHVFHFKFLEFPMSDSLGIMLDMYSGLVMLLGRVPQLVVAFLASSELGTIDQMAVMTMFASFMVIIMGVLKWCISILHCMAGETDDRYIRMRQL